MADNTKLNKFQSAFYDVRDAVANELEAADNFDLREGDPDYKSTREVALWMIENFKVLLEGVEY